MANAFLRYRPQATEVVTVFAWSRYLNNAYIYAIHLTLENKPQS